jgi:hypothetical protein
MISGTIPVVIPSIRAKTMPPPRAPRLAPVVQHDAEVAAVNLSVTVEIADQGGLNGQERFVLQING